MARTGRNKVMLKGNLTQNAELRYTQDGTPVATIRMATNVPYYNRSAGKQEERTEYHTVIGWGKRFEALHGKECLLRSQGVDIEGRLQTRSYDHKTATMPDGKTPVRMYTTEVVIGGRDEDFILDGSPRNRPQVQQDAPPVGDSEVPPEHQSPPVSSNKDRPEGDDFAE